MREEPDAWSSVFEEMEADLRRWRAAHPAATLTELEQALDHRLRAVRVALLAEVAGDVPEPEHCPACGAHLVHRGQHARTLTTQGGTPLPLQRAYLTCPACGAGLFPPG